MPAGPGARSTSAALALGIERFAAHGLQGRAVMVDLAARFGRKRTVVGHEQLMQALDADRLAIEPGDMVCLHTGFAQTLLEMSRAPDARLRCTSISLLFGYFIFISRAQSTNQEKLPRFVSAKCLPPMYTLEYTDGPPGFNNTYTPAKRRSL